MDEQRTWTSEEAMGNLESLTRLQWGREELPEGVRELLQAYEAAIPQMTSEIRSLRQELRGKTEAEGQPEGASSSSSAYEDLAEFAKRLGLDQQ